MNKQGWIGVDLDGTLAHYDHWRGPDHVGAPVPAMVDRVKRWLAEGRDVRIMTARIAATGDFVDSSGMLDTGEFAGQQAQVIQEWCRQHIGAALPITCRKDYAMVELWDDRAVQIIPNTGQRADGQA